MENNICIVVVGYNRVDSLSRCLNRLNDCYYNVNIDLYISIDDSINNKNTTQIAENFIWKFGKKHLILHQKRLGLKNHVLRCGNIVNEENYSGIIMLEDDIYVADDFFNYVQQCIGKYDSCEEIAGISLYKHSWNIDAKMPFNPIQNGDDVYFVQYAQSWGQAWSKRMWNDFYNWYLDNSKWDENCSYLPDNVLNWSKNSWLKYFIKYCALFNKYFVYPYISLSTNFSDLGEHNRFENLSMHRELFTGIDYKYKLPNIKDSIALYDTFFESMSLQSNLNISNVTIDLYGRKKEYKRYLLTTNKLNYKMVNKFGLYLKPIELNIIQNITGNDIYLYDTTYKESNLENNKKYKMIGYYWFNFDIKETLLYLIYIITNRIKK